MSRYPPFPSSYLCPLHLRLIKSQIFISQKITTQRHRSRCPLWQSRRLNWFPDFLSYILAKWQWAMGREDTERVWSVTGTFWSLSSHFKPCPGHPEITSQSQGGLMQSKWVWCSHLTTGHRSGPNLPSDSCMTNFHMFPSTHHPLSWSPLSWEALCLWTIIIIIIIINTGRGN